MSARIRSSTSAANIAACSSSQIAAMPPLAVRSAKAAILDAAERNLTDGLARERASFFDLFDTEDQAEGMAAFTQKRRPTWSGR